MKIDNDKVREMSDEFLGALNKYSKDHTVNYLEVISAIDAFRAFLIKKAETDMKKMQESN